MDQKLRERFDVGSQRRGTQCEKWDDCTQVFGRADVLPMWVADMDFPCPQPVIDAMVERARTGVFGYGMHDPRAERALVDWMLRRHGLDLQPDWVRTTPGVISSMLYALRALAQPGDTVAIMTPVYGPFYRMARQAQLHIYRSPLVQVDGEWRMDLAQLERGFQSGVRALMLCSPHNPVGRIWTRAELTELAALCNRYDVGIVSDEIHMDFAMPGHRHTPILSVPGAERAILLASATKTFNLAALKHSSLLVKGESLRARIDEIMKDAGVPDPNLFGQLAQTVAYEQGEGWLDALIEYVDENRQLTHDFLAARLPEIVPGTLEGTYLQWLDMRALGLDQRALMELWVQRAGVAPSSGTDFGPEGEGFVRFNLATPQSNVVEALGRLESAVRAK